MFGQSIVGEHYGPAPCLILRARVAPICVCQLLPCFDSFAVRAVIVGLQPFTRRKVNVGDDAVESRALGSRGVVLLCYRILGVLSVANPNAIVVEAGLHVRKQHLLETTDVPYRLLL